MTLLIAVPEDEYEILKALKNNHHDMWRLVWMLLRAQQNHEFKVTQEMVTNLPDDNDMQTTTYEDNARRCVVYKATVRK